MTVEASALHAQTQSGERSGTIRADEIEGTQLRGRDFLGLLQGMPGVVDTNVRNAPGWNAFLGTQINGLSDQLMGMSYDGVSSKDTGFGAANYVTPSLDSIAEVKVQTSNYQAEYGRAGGANIIVVTKSGSSRFSGSAAYFKRHEGLTTNTWDRRRTCDATGRHLAVVREAALPLRQLRVHAGRTGPDSGLGVQRGARQAVLLLLAGSAAADRSVPGEQHHAVGARAQRRLLADAEQRRAAPVHPQSVQRASLQREQRWRRLLPGQRDSAEHDSPDGPADVESVPVAGSGAGGQSGHSGGIQLPVRWRHREAAPGPRRPRRLEHPAGHDVLYAGPDGQGSLRPRPVQRHRARPDRRRRHGLPVVERQLRHQHDRATWRTLPTSSRPRPCSRSSRAPTGRSRTSTRWSSPTGMRSTTGITCPATGSTSPRTTRTTSCRTSRSCPPVAPTRCRTRRNINIGQGQAFPWLATNDTHNFSVNLTHVRGSHNMKAGFFYERTGRPGALSSNAGTYNFNSDAANPLDTNLGWANAALGHLNTYTENNNNQRSMPVFNQPEFFVQDNWRVSRQFTLDLGVRFSHIGVVYDRGRDIGWFDPGSLESGERGGAVAAALRQRRVPLHRRESGGAQSGERRNAAEPVDRRHHRRVGRHQQRDGLRQGTPRHLPQRRHQDGAASRVRLGRLRGRQDGGPRRIRHELQPARRRPVWRVHRRDLPDGQPAVDHHRRSLPDALHPVPSRGHAWSRTKPDRLRCTRGASACSTSCRGV